MPRALVLCLVAAAAASGASTVSSAESGSVVSSAERPAAGEQPAASQPARQWLKLADGPADPAGREYNPGLLGAWLYLQATKSFLLYGGRTPAFNNGMWKLDLSGGWTAVRCDDTVVNAATAGHVLPRTARPDQIIWSPDRPGAADSHGVCWDGDTGSAWFLGGFRYSPDWPKSWATEGKVGLWRYDPAADRFIHADPKAPEGVFRLAYDQARRLVVAVPAQGGQKDCHTYQPAAGNWTRLAGPKAGDYPAMAYDPAARLTVLFTAAGETWTFDGKEWKQAQPKQSPPARHHGGMCYAPELGGVVLVGGMTGNTVGWVYVERGQGSIYQDVWTYDARGDTWRQVPAAGLPRESVPKYGYYCDGLTYDPDSQALVLFEPNIGVWGLPLGSRTVRPAPVNRSIIAPSSPIQVAGNVNPKITALGDNQWGNLDVRVPGGWEIGLCYDQANRLIFKYGGCGTGPLAPGDYAYSNSLWVMDVASGLWHCRRPVHMYGATNRPVNGCGRAFCYDSNRNVIWTINAVSSMPTGGGFGLFSYDAAADRFEGPFGGPHGTSTAMCHDPDDDILLLLNRNNASYVFDCKTKNWSGQIKGPPTSGYDQIVWVPELKLFVFPARADTGQTADKPDLAGLGPTRALGDPRKGAKFRVVTMQTWAFDPATRTWKDLAPRNQIQPPRTYFGVCYDSKNKVVILTGGQNALWSDKAEDEAPVNDVWVYHPKENAWTKMEPANPPPARQLKAACVFDSEHGVMVTAINHGLWAYRFRK